MGRGIGQRVPATTQHHRQAVNGLVLAQVETYLYGDAGFTRSGRDSPAFRQLAAKCVNQRGRDLGIIALRLILALRW